MKYRFTVPISISITTILYSYIVTVPNLIKNCYCNNKKENPWLTGLPFYYFNAKIMFKKVRHASNIKKIKTFTSLIFCNNFCITCAYQLWHKKRFFFRIGSPDMFFNYWIYCFELPVLLFHYCSWPINGNYNIVIG